MSYEVLEKKEYAGQLRVVSSDIDFCVKRVCTMTPNQALAIIRATRPTLDDSSVVNRCLHRDAIDAYDAAVMDYIDHGNHSYPMDPDKPMRKDKWQLVRNICVDCLGMKDWFNEGGE